jgi:two-component system sensor histidine kinase FlrB
MTAVFAELSGGLPLVAPLATVAAVGLRSERRRRGLNEALHELRRPLQALALTASFDRLGGHTVESSLRMTEAALARLDREINGGAVRLKREQVGVDALVTAAASRWEQRARRAGVELGVGRVATGKSIEADACAIAQALDNLVVNAIEHGASPIRIEAGAGASILWLAVSDAGSGPRRPARTLRTIARRSRSRHGHGLRVVRRTAADHGGSFGICRDAGRNVAVIELPLRPRGSAG